MNTFDCPHCGQCITATPGNNAGILSRFNMGQGVEAVPELGRFRTVRTELRKADLTSDFLFPVFVGLVSFFSLLVILALYGFMSGSELGAIDAAFWAFCGAFGAFGTTLTYNQRGRFHEESEPIEVEAVAPTVATMPAVAHTAQIIHHTSKVSRTYQTVKVPVSMIAMRNVAKIVNNSDFRFSRPYLADNKQIISGNKYRQLHKFMFERGFIQKTKSGNELTSGGKAFLRSYLR